LSAAYALRGEAGESKQITVTDLACDDPFRVVVLVATVVKRHDVDQQGVLGLRVKALHGHLKGREHPSENHKKRKKYENYSINFQYNSILLKSKSAATKKKKKPQ
jgi:hypothetical protein